MARRKAPTTRIQEKGTNYAAIEVSVGEIPSRTGLRCLYDQSTARNAGRPGSYPIRKVTTPVPVEGGVAGGALPMSAGTSPHGRRKPNGSACQRRTVSKMGVAGVQDEAKHAISAMCR
jgi:hypothetical protein